MSSSVAYRCFEAFGMEVEYAVVDAASLDPKPDAWRLLPAASMGSLGGGAASSRVGSSRTGSLGAEKVADRSVRVSHHVTRQSKPKAGVHPRVVGPASGLSSAEVAAVGRSHELVQHVVEVKHARPVKDLVGLWRPFYDDVRRMHQRLAPFACTLLPGGMHPWLDPKRDTLMWEGLDAEIFEAYEAIFGCQTHGWTNIQSVQLNLSFAGDEEFFRLHTALRALLPIIPALSAGTPWAHGILVDDADVRLREYRRGVRNMPGLTGIRMPELVRSQEAYERDILSKNHALVADHPLGYRLQKEWLNNRAAIPRFERSALEIRLMDAQESPLAEAAIVVAVVSVLRALHDGVLSDPSLQAGLETATLQSMLEEVTKNAENAVISSPSFLRVMGLPAGIPMRAGEVWRALLARVPLEPTDEATQQAVELLLSEGSLASRIRLACPTEQGLPRTKSIARELQACLLGNRMLSNATLS